MPTVEWNKQKWGGEINRFMSRNKSSYFYGNQWGDPEVTGLRHWLQRLTLRSPGNLSKVVPRYIRPYVTPQSVVLEIGAGGGRWTQYLVTAKEIIVVDLNREFFPYLRQRFQEHCSKFRFYQTSGYDLDGIMTDSVDFLFTFGAFVHIDPDGIQAYLGNIKRVLKPGAVAVIQYADKTKKLARIYVSFSDMTPGMMEDFIAHHGFKLLEHNTRLLRHSSIAVVQKCP